MGGCFQCVGGSSAPPPLLVFRPALPCQLSLKSAPYTHPPLVEIELVTTIFTKMDQQLEVKIFNYTIRARRACALRALGLLLADGVLTVGWGKTFWRVRRVPTRKRA